MLNNDVVTLKPISEKDTDFILELRNDLEIADQFFSDAPLYDFVHNNWLKTRNKDDLDFIIFENRTQKKAGRIYITHIDYRHQKGEYGIVIHPRFRSRNLATEATSLLINYVFNNLPMNKLSLEVFIENKKAINLYQKIGFVEEGILKEEFFKNGTFKDIIKMRLLKSEWKNSIK